MKKILETWHKFNKHYKKNARICAFSHNFIKKTAISVNTNPTAAHIEKGKAGEDLAAAYLESKGWHIAERNWRAGRGEIDIIAWADDKLLVFIEVKTRSSDSYGGPERGITTKKRKKMAYTAGLYMEAIGYEWEIRFDVVALVLRNETLLELRHVEDAFFPAG